MKRQRKLIASLIATTILLTCNNNYKVTFATENNMEENTLESTNVTSNTEDENINTKETVTDENPESSSENTSSKDEGVKNDTTDDLLDENPEVNEGNDVVLTPDTDTDTSTDTDNTVVDTDNGSDDNTVDNNCDEIVSEENGVINNTENNITPEESEVDSQEIDEYVKIRLNGIQVNGTVLDLNNITTPTITVDVADEFKETMTVNIQLVNINDTSKTLTYSGRNTNVATLNTSSVPGDGIYEISKIELRESGYSEFYDLAYINPKYESIVVTPSHNVELADFSNGFQLEVKNSTPLSFSFESFSAPSVVSNGDGFTPTITIKSNKEITHVSAFYKSDNDSIYVSSNDNISKNGDYYTINLVGMTYAEGYTPTEYLRSGEYSIYSLFLNYSETLSDGTTSSYKLVFANTTTAGIFENDGVYDFSALNISCDNPNQDITPPTITDAYLEKNTVMPGEDIDLKIYVTDDDSGFYGRWQDAYYTWTNENGDEIYGPSSYDESIGAFVGYAYIDEDAKPGVYTLTKASIYDKAYNLVDLSKIDPSILSKLTITVGNPGSGDNNGGSGGNGSGSGDNNGSGGNGGNGGGSDNGNNNGSTGDNGGSDNNNGSGNNNGSTGNGSNGGEDKPTENKPTIIVKPENKPSTTTQTSQSTTTSKLPQTGDASALPLLGLLALSLGTILKGKKKI